MKNKWQKKNGSLLKIYSAKVQGDWIEVRATVNHQERWFAVSAIEFDKFTQDNDLWERCIDQGINFEDSQEFKDHLQAFLWHFFNLSSVNQLNKTQN